VTGSSFSVSQYRVVGARDGRARRGHVNHLAATTTAMTALCKTAPSEVAHTTKRSSPPTMRQRPCTQRSSSRLMTDAISKSLVRLVASRRSSLGVRVPRSAPMTELRLLGFAQHHSSRQSMERFPSNASLSLNSSSASHPDRRGARSGAFASNHGTETTFHRVIQVEVLRRRGPIYRNERSSDLR